MQGEKLDKVGLENIAHNAENNVGRPILHLPRLTKGSRKQSDRGTVGLYYMLGTSHQHIQATFRILQAAPAVEANFSKVTSINMIS